MYVEIPPLETRFSREPLTRWSRLCESLGDLFFSLDGSPIVRGDKIPRSKRLPAVLDSNQVVCGDLIPETSWGSSLANMLTKKSWDSLRHPLIEANNNICQVCGTPHDSLDVHEIWHYAYPGFEMAEKARVEGASAFGKQTLEGLVTVCKECHKFYHLGLANVKGELDEVLERMARINGWSSSYVWAYYREVSTRWERNSQYQWVLDFSKITHPEGGLTLKSSWEAHPDDEGLVHMPKSRFGNITAITHIAWKVYGEKGWRPVQSGE